MSGRDGRGAQGGSDSSYGRAVAADGAEQYEEHSTGMDEVTYDLLRDILDTVLHGIHSLLG